MGNLQEQIQRILQTRENITWETIGPEKEHNGLATGIILVEIGAYRREITDMDYDMAMNDPSRLNTYARGPHTKVKMQLTINTKNGKIVSHKILSKWKVKVKRR